jgi:hypothetical protein
MGGSNGSKAASQPQERRDKLREEGTVFEIGHSPRPIDFLTNIIGIEIDWLKPIGDALF